MSSCTYACPDNDPGTESTHTHTQRVTVRHSVTRLTRSHLILWQPGPANAECDEIPIWSLLLGRFHRFPTNGQGLKCKSENWRHISSPNVNFSGGLHTSRPYHPNSEPLRGETRYLAYMWSPYRQTLYDENAARRVKRLAYIIHTVKWYNVFISHRANSFCPVWNE